MHMHMHMCMDMHMHMCMSTRPSAGCGGGSDVSEAASTWSARISRRELDLARRCGAPGGGPAAPGGVFQRMRGVADRRSLLGARALGDAKENAT